MSEAVALAADGGQWRIAKGACAVIFGLTLPDTAYEAAAEDLLRGCHLSILGIPWHQHADPRLTELVETAELLLGIAGDGGPGVHQAQAWGYRLPIDGPFLGVLVKCPDDSLAAEVRRQFLGVFGKRL